MTLLGSRKVPTTDGLDLQSLRLLLSSLRQSHNKLDILNTVQSELSNLPQDDVSCNRCEIPWRRSQQCLSARGGP